MLSLANIKKTVLLCSVFTAMVSCTSQEQQKPADLTSTPQIIMGDNAGVFRGFNLGDSLSTIVRKEAGKPIETDSGYLYYEHKLFDTLGSYNITYNFDEKGLYEIQSNIFINNAASTETVLNSFKAYFDKYYGASRTEMGFNVWSVKSAKFGEVKINLSDESSDFTIDNAPGKLSLWIYKDDSNT
jgi:hypothetical protein